MKAMILEAGGRSCELVVDILVQKWALGWGSYTTVEPLQGGYAQCYYNVVLLIEQ